MIIDKDLIKEAKSKYTGAAEEIGNDLKIENFDLINLKGGCPFGHSDSTPSFIWNPKDDCFHCFSCGVNYGIIDHYMSFYNLTYLGAVEKLFQQVDIKYRFGEKNVRVHRDYVYPHREQNADRSAVEKYLALRKISKETLDYCDVQQDAHNNVVFHFYDLNDVVTVVKYRPARKVEKGEIKTWCQKDKDTKNILFNMNRIDPTKPLLICEGEIDNLSIIESGYKNATSVPLGAGNFQWIEECWDFLQQFEKIIIWADNDESGVKMRKEACARLGTWRTLFVDLPKEIHTETGEVVRAKDANEVLYYQGPQAVLDLINNAQEVPITGITDLSIVDDFDIEQAQGLYTHLKPVDDIVYKFLFGSVLLLTGIKGSGKSTFLDQAFICESLDQGYDVFLYSAELSSPVVKSWVELIMAGVDAITMKNEFVHIIDGQAKKEMRQWYKERIWIYDDESNKADDILDRAINTIRKYGVKTVVLDNLMTIDIGASDTNMLQKQKDFIVKLVRIAKQYDVLIVLVSHPRKTMAGVALTSDDISGANELGNLAQYILSVHRYTQAEKKGEKDSKGNYKRGKEPVKYDVGLDVLKNRYTGKIGRADLYFHYGSYRFHSKSQELYKRYKWDKSNKQTPSDYPKDFFKEPDLLQ